MKIAVVTWYFPTREEIYRGHSAYQTLRKLCRLAEIEVLCPQPQYPTWMGPRSFRNHTTDFSYTPPELKVRYFGYPVIPLVSRPLNSVVCARHLRPLLTESRPDVILNYKVYPEGHAAVLLGQELGIPVVVTAIGSDLNRIPDPLTQRLTVSTLRGATLVATVSHHLRSRAIALGAQRTRAILNGCDSTVFHCADRQQARVGLNLRNDSKLIVFVGRIDVLKGAAELAEAFATLQDPQTNLVLLGEGPASDLVQACGERHGCADRIRILPPCSSSTVARWMAAADVVTLPSYAEGCPNVVVEALNCGRPVVATQVGGIPELINESNGVLVPPRDAAALAAGLNQALSRPWNDGAIAAASARGWEQVAQETYQACEWAIANFRSLSTDRAADAAAQAASQGRDHHVEF